MKLKINRAFLALALAVGASVSLIAHKAFAASDTGNAIQVVVAAIAITNASDLDFGTESAGAIAKTVLPGAVENAENGSFDVTGEANTAYTITLPVDGTVVMQTGGGGANETIAVDTFASFPAAGANGLLDGSGQQLLLVGATRAALGALQVAGSYTTTYTVTVVY